jgi:predicted Zn-dependent protease
MKRGDHRLALVRLAALNDRNPSNSSLRLLSSYALLQLGNLAESLAEAQRSHDAADHGVYQCYVLAHVAAINGNKELARREIGHVNGAGDAAMKAEMEVLSRKVATN